MKKLTRKLFLSCAALCVCAATLVSTTFAWYTTNTEVEANNISGASAATGSTSVFISNNGSTGWAQKLDAANGEITVSNTQLSPVALKTESEQTKWVDAKGNVVQSPSYIDFTLYFKTAKISDAQDAAGVNLGIKSIKVKNTTGRVKTADNLITGTTYSVDILKALAIQIDSATKAELKQHGYSLTPGQGCVSYAEGASASDYTDNPIVGDYASAHAYANAVVADSVTEDTTQTTALNANTVVAVLPANGNATSVTFRIFLDGADVDCFDACKDQQFSISIQFAVVQSQS